MEHNYTSPPTLLEIDLDGNCLTPIDRQLPTRQSSQRGAVLSGLGKFHWPDLDLVPG